MALGVEPPHKDELGSRSTPGTALPFQTLEVPGDTLPVNS
jgi:hypothetical protein